MKIVVVSDTHMPRMAKELPAPLIRELEGADLILHAGDWTEPEVYRMLSRYGKVIGVAGNNDGEPLTSKLGTKRIVQAGTKQIGLVHGHLPSRSRTAQQNAVHAFKGEQLDAIVFGHSHVPLLQWQNGVLLFNPGSPTAKRKQPRFSFGVISIQGDQLAAKHYYFDK